MTHESQTGRQYGVDLLRIIAMQGVLMHHFMGHGGIMDAVEPLSPAFAVVWLLDSFAICTVNCFALVSGYVAGGRRVRYANLAYLWLEVLFYSAGIAAIFYAKHLIRVTLVIRALLPVTMTQYWFFTAYFGMFLLSPLLNCVIERMDRRELRLSLAVVFACFTVLSRADQQLFGLNSGYCVLWLCLLYILGGTIRRYRLFARVPTGRLLALTLGSCAATWLVQLAAAYVTVHRSGEVLFTKQIVSFLTPATVLLSVGLLLLFSRLRVVRLRRFVAAASPLTFAAYLIQDNKHVRTWLIKDRFAAMADAGALRLLLFIPGITLLTFLACVAIDALRDRLFRWLRIRQRLDALEAALRQKLPAEE